MRIIPKNILQSLPQIILLLSALLGSAWSTISVAQPTFTLSNPTLPLEEDFGSQSVTVIPGTGGNRPNIVRYSISATNLGFVRLSIDANSGTITLTSVDNAFGGQTIVTVTAADDADNTNQATQTLTVSVSAVDDPPTVRTDLTRVLTYSGSNNPDGDLSNGAAEATQYNNPIGIAVTDSSNVLVADRDNHFVRLINQQQISSSFIGNGTNTNSLSDGDRLQVAVAAPYAIATSGARTFFTSHDHAIRVLEGNSVTLYAGATAAGATNGSRSAARFRDIRGILATANGLYVADSGNHVIRFINQAGVVSTFSGIVGDAGFGDVSNPQYRNPNDIAVGPDGRLFVADTNGNHIRVMNADGSNNRIYAGSSFVGNRDGLANSITSAGARFRQPRGVTVAADGRVFLADTGNHRIRVVTADGSRVSTYVGAGSGFFDGDSALARFNSPTKMAWLPDGRLLVADSGNDRIRIIEQATTLTARTVSSVGTIFGSATVQNALFDIDSSLSYSISAGNDSQLFAIDSLSGAIRLLRIPTESEAEPLYQLTVTLQADGEIANLPVEIGFAPISNFTPSFTLTTTAITLDEDAGTTAINLIASSDDGDSAIAQTLTYTVSPLNTGAATLSINSTNGVLNITTIDDAFGAATITVTVNDGGNVNNRFTQTLTLTIAPVTDIPRTAAVSGIVRNYAGNGVGTPFVGGSAATAQFRVSAMAVAPDGRLFIADNNADSVFVIDANGSTLSVFNANPGVNQFNPRGVAVTNDGQRILAVDVSGENVIYSISMEDSVVYAGTGPFGAADGPSTTVATFGILGGIALDAEGALFIGSQSQPIIRMVSTDGATVSTVAGVNGEVGSTDGPIADARFTITLFDIATAPDGRLFIADAFNNRIRVINAARTEVSTYAGTGARNRRDGAALTEAQLSRPLAIALAPDGRLFFIDQDNQSVIRVVSADGATVSTYAGGSNSLVNGPLHSARFNSINDLAFAPDGRLFIASANRIRVIEEARARLSGTVQRAGAIALQSNFTQSLFFDADNLENPGSGINLTYAIVGGNGNGLFTINTDNGEISLTTTPAEGEAGSYTLTIAASNAVGTATATTTITLEEIDNFPPIFTLSTNDLILDEDFGSSAITIASSNDGDPDVEQTLTYSLDDAYDTDFATLTIDPNSGVVTISSIENAFGVATITVIATDSSGASSTQPFTLTVNPVNDIPQLPSGLIVRTYAGSGNAGNDNGTIHQASFTEPYGIAVINDGNVVISENNRGLRIINPNSGTVSDYGTLDFQQPAGLDFSPTIANRFTFAFPGVFIAERTLNRVRRYDIGFPATVGTFESFTPYNHPRDVAYDPDSGRLFIADSNNHRIQVIEDITSNPLRASIYAGSSSATAGAIDGPAAEAQFRNPTSIALAPDGRLFVTDSGNNLIRVISADGATVSTYAGDASPSTIDYLDGSTSTARFNLPYGIAVATDGRVFVADRDNHSIRLIDAEGSTVSTYAGGNGNESVINGLASNATFNMPTSIAIDAQGRVLVTDLSNHLIRSIEQGSLDESVEPFLSAAEQTTGAIVLDAATIQGLFIDADSDTLTYSLSNNNANTQALFAISSTNGAITLAATPSDRQTRESILTITASDQHGAAATGSISVFLEDGNDSPTFTLSTSRLDLNEDFGRREVTITSSDDGDFFVTQTLSYSLSHSADSVDVTIDPQSGTITIISIPNANSTNTINVIATDSAGGVSTQTLTIAVAPVADPLTAVQSVRVVSTYAGDGNKANDNGSATAASFNNPYGIAVAPDGRLFVSDQDGHQIRLIDPTGSTVSTYAGSAGSPGTNIGATGVPAQFRQPTGLVLIPVSNSLYVADRGNHCIRLAIPSSLTHAGTAAELSGECGDANASLFSEPRGVAVNTTNASVFVADSNNHRIRLLTNNGDITSNYAGDGISGFADGSTATARFNTPVDVALAPDGRLFVADSNNHRIRVISADGTVSTYAGDGNRGNRNGSSALAARFDTPSGLALAEDGRLFVVDRNNHSIRVISADGNTVSTYAGDGSSGMNNAFGDAARFDNPLNAAIHADGRLFVTDSANQRIRLIQSTTIASFRLSVSASAQTVGGTALSAGFAQGLFQDPDGRDLEYSIIAGNQSGLFSINQDNGTISFAAITTEEQAGTYTLTIQANDDSNSATNTITLFLEPLDNYPPSFSLSEDAMSLAEDFGTATLSIVNPDDGDSLLTQTLNYSFSSDKALTFAQLTIDPVSGTLTITSLADAFGGPLSITITATDSSGATAIQTFTLTVTPVNDPPVVVQSLPVVSTYAGNGSAGNVLGSTATAQFSSPYSIGIATDGRVFVADRGNNRVRVIDAAGSAVTTYNDTNFPDLRGLEVAHDGRVYVVQEFRLQVINTDGSLTTYGDSAATRADGRAQGAPIPRARFFRPADVAVATNGTVFITEVSGFTIRRLRNGFVSTHAGDGNFGFDDGSSFQASFASPTGITVAADGRIFSMDSQGGTRVRLTEFNTVSTYAGGRFSGSQDGTANNARFGQAAAPNGVVNNVGLAIAPDGRLFVADRANHRIRVISADGNVVSTYVGSSQGNSNGIAAQFNAPTDIEIAPDGRIFVADTNNHRIQVITETPIAELATTTLSTAEQQVAGAQLLSASVIQRLFRDPDGDSLSYAITGGNQDGLFALQNDNLVLSNSIVEGQAGDYAVVLEARESGDNAGVATTTWAVRIEPLDNYPPIFTLSTTALTLTEDFESAVQVSVVNPSDGDSGVEQTLTYSAHTDDVVAAIAIDSQSGTITLNSVANAFGETAITVVATDSSGTSTLRVLNLSITPVIDPVVTAPILIARTYAGSGSNGSDNGAALEASFSFPYGIAVAPDGRVFVSENAGRRIRMISADGATVSTYAGDGSTNVLNQPAGLSLAPDGRLFIADSGNNRIRVVSADGNTLSTYAEGGLNSPRAVALNADGRLFIADFSNHLIRTASPDGTISTYAGDGTAAFNDGSTATAQFDVPADLAVRPNGSLLVADRDNHRIRSINAGNVSTFAGNGETEVLNQPFGIALAADGGVFVLDRSNQRIRLLSRDGSALNTYAGSGVAGFKDGLALEAEFNNPTHIATAPDGRLFVVDFGNHRIRVIEESTNAITLRTVSGSEQEAGSTLFQAQTLFINADGDDLNYRLISASNDGGALFTIDSNNGRVSPLTAPIESQAGTYTLVIEASHAAGATTAAVVIGLQPLDNYPPSFTLSTTTVNIKQGEDTLQISVTASDDGDSGVDQAITYSISRSNVSFATLTISENSGLITISNVPDTFGREATVSVTATDSSGASSVQSIVIRGYIVSRFAQSASVYAGSGFFGSDNGSTTTARFDTPRGLAYAADGRLFVADSLNDRIRVIDANGSTVSTYAGRGFFGSADGSTTTASFGNPFGLALAADGRLFVADSDNHRIRVIDANGSIVSTYAGSGTFGSDNGSTTTASFANPSGLALAADGRLFVSDRSRHIIRVIDANGSIVSTYAGTGGFSFVFDGSTTTATFNGPRGLALAADGRLFVADDQNRLIRVVDAKGSTVSTYAGVIGGGRDFDGSTATATFSRPFDVLQAGKTLFVADGANQAVRVIDASGTVSTLLLENNLLGVNLGTPLGLAISTDGRRVFVSHNRNQIIVVNTGNTVPTLTLSQNSLSLQSGFSPQTIGVTAADADDNDQVVVSVSGNTLGLLSISTAADSITLSNAGTANGQITLTVSAIDDLGATASERLTVTISGGSGGGSSGGGGDSSGGGGGGGGGGGCSLQSAMNHPIDTTLWWLLLLSLALLTVRAYTTRRPQKNLQHNE